MARLSNLPEQLWELNCSSSPAKSFSVYRGPILSILSKPLVIRRLSVPFLINHLLNSRTVENLSISESFVIAAFASLAPKKSGKQID
jgi:hypothetical protein